MLRLVLGRAGSGKTRFAIDRACEALHDGKKAVLVVPEQFTFETERSLLHAAGPESCLGVEVLSFSRMAHRVMSEYGGAAGDYLDDCGRTILMYRAIRQVADLLRVYGRQAQYPAFAKTMVDTVSEYKLCQITPQALDETVKKVGDGLLREKLADISLIMRAYDALVDNGLRDTADDLTRLAAALQEHAFFQGKVVIVDSFKGFTPQEKAVLREILTQAGDVYITLCANQLDDVEKGYGLFSPVRETAQKLIALANKAGVLVAKPVTLGEIRRFQSPALRALESRVFRSKPEPYEGPAGEIHLVSAANAYDEAQFVAQEIARLIREEGVRCRDIVVISRTLEPVRGILDPVFEKYEIPLFFDTRRGIETHPLMTLLLCALESIAANYRFEPVFRYLKTGLAGLDTIEVSRLENYALTWELRGADAWQQEWLGNPEGFAGEMTAPLKEELRQLNILRQKAAAPLGALARELGQAAGTKGMLAALYGFLKAIHADRAVAQAHARLLAAGEVELADEYRQIWDKLMHLLDQAASALGDMTLTVSEFYELLRLAVSAGELAHIPPSLDEVTAGDAERIRSGQARYAFVIGLAEGVFPQTQSAGGVITDAEREKLISLGLELAPPARERIVEERYLAYKAFTGASEGLYLSYPRSDAAGKVMRPSHFLTHVRGLFPQCDSRDEALGDEFDGVQNVRSALDALSLGFGRPSPLQTALRGYFGALSEYDGRLRALEAAAVKKPAAVRDAKLARALYGEQLQISPSRLESFGQCRFLYFCRYGLRARPRRKAELMAPEIGTLIHFVLEKLLSGRQGRKISELEPPALRQIVDGLLTEFADVYLGGLDNKPERFKYLYLRLRETVLTLVGHIAKELEQSDFYPVDFELPIGGGEGGVPPAVIPLPDGGTIAVEGKVDRVDLMKRGGKTWLRVIDYKTGTKTFNLPDVLYGLNLQMFIYLFTLCDNAPARYASPELLPAGVLYLPARRPDIAAERGQSEEELLRQADGGLKMSGMVAARPEVIDGMEHGARGLFIPARLKEKAADGEDPIDQRSSIATLEQFGALKRHIEKTLTQMARTLREGDVAALPVEGLGYHPCDYCDYRSVCRFEKGDGVRYLHTVKDVWGDLKGDDGNG